MDFLFIFYWCFLVPNNWEGQASLFGFIWGGFLLFILLLGCLLVESCSFLYNYYIRKNKVGEMIDYCSLAEKRLSYQNERDLMELLKQKDELIQEQGQTIASLEQKMKVLKADARRMRESMLYQVFKKKYEEEYKMRAEFEKYVYQKINIIVSKLSAIETGILKQLKGVKDMSSFGESEEMQVIKELSESISEIRGTADRETTLDLGDVTKVEVRSILPQLEGKMEFVETIFEIFVAQYEKISLEHDNVRTLIKAGKKGVQAELKSYKQALDMRTKERNDLQRALSEFEAEKERWSEAYQNLGHSSHKKSLLNFGKEELIEQIVKLMYCTKKLSKQKEEKEKELKNFKEGEKKRYQTFLANLRVGR